METKTKYNAFDEATMIAEPVKKEYENKFNKIVQNAALIITLITIFSCVILYAFNTGVIKVYNIPNNYIYINLQTYIPIVMKLCGIYSYGVFYYVQHKTDKIFNKKRFNFLRLLYGEAIFLFATNWIGFEGPIPTIITLIIPVLIELFYFFAVQRRKPFKNKEISDESTYKFQVETYVQDALGFLYHNKKGVCFVIIAILFAPNIGTMYAKNKTDYEIINIKEDSYAIVVDYLDKAVIQKAQINKNELTIDSTTYQLISKEDIIIKCQEFEKVTIKGET